MTTGCSPSSHSILKGALRRAFPLDDRRVAVLAALVLAMLQARSVVLYTTRYQRLRRFVQFDVPDGLFTRFVLGVLPPDELWLILDRTSWKLGQQDVNILLLSATWKSFSFPLLWTLLPHGGASAQRDRQALLERFLAFRGERQIAGVLADREFVGREWFKFLDQHHLQPCIRLRADSKLNGVPVWACFRKLRVGEVRVWHRAAPVYGVRLRVLATRNAAGEMLYLAYRGWSGKNLARYALRWQTENLHAALKTRGFNLEDTGLTKAERVSTLLIAVSLAFVWACLTGEFEAARQSVRRKNHGYNEISVFRLGLDTLQDLLQHPSPASWCYLAALIPRFER